MMSPYMLVNLFIVIFTTGFASIAVAYVTDIKISSCSLPAPCQAFPGFARFPVDINTGADGHPINIYYSYSDNTQVAAITDFKVLRSVNGVLPYLDGYTRLDVNLTGSFESEEEKWLFFTKDPKYGSPIDSLLVKKGNNPSAGFGYRRIQLNDGQGDNEVYLFYSQIGPQSPLTAITGKWCLSSECYMPEEDGWHRIDMDLNKGIIIAARVYLFYKSEPGQPPITDIQVVMEGQTPPENYTLVNTNLNRGTIRGPSIYLWYRTGGSEEPIQVLTVGYGDVVVPAGFKKLDNVDLNYGAGGEALWLMYRREYFAPPRPLPLLFNPTGRFKILQLADIHFSTDNGECRDVPTSMDCIGDPNTQAFIDRLLDEEKPDLVVFSGDNVQGYTSYDTRSTIFKYTKSVVAKKVPWAMVFGNHDDEGDLSREEMFHVIREIPYFVGERGPVDVEGVGNYILKIYQNQSNEASGMDIVERQQSLIHKFTLYFLDSHSYSSDEEKYPGYAWILPSQIKWYISTAKQILSSQHAKGQQDNPLAMTFLHIPLPEFDYDESQGFLGDKKENVSSPSYNSGFFQAMKEIGRDVKVVAAGHDHVNDYCLWLQDINLCYGGGMGYGTYGASHLGWPRRARIFELYDYGETVVTWKRLDDDDLTMIHFETLY